METLTECMQLHETSVRLNKHAGQVHPALLQYLQPCRSWQFTDSVFRLVVCRFPARAAYASASFAQRCGQHHQKGLLLVMNSPAASTSTLSGSPSATALHRLFFSSIIWASTMPALSVHICVYIYIHKHQMQVRQDPSVCP